MTKWTKRYQLTRRAANASWSNRTAKIGQADTLREAIRLASNNHGTTITIVDTVMELVGSINAWGGPQLSMTLPVVWWVELGVLAELSLVE